MDNRSNQERSSPPPLPPRRCPLSPSLSSSSSSSQSTITSTKLKKISNVHLSTLPVRSLSSCSTTTTTTTTTNTNIFTNPHPNPHLIPPRLPPQSQVTSDDHRRHQQLNPSSHHRIPAGTTTSSLLSPRAAAAAAALRSSSISPISSPFTPFSRTSQSSASLAIAANRSTYLASSTPSSANTSTTDTSASVSAVNLLVPRPQSERKLNDYTDTPLQPQGNKQHIRNINGGGGGVDSESSDSSDIENSVRRQDGIGASQSQPPPLPPSTHRSINRSFRVTSGATTVVVEQPRKNILPHYKPHILPAEKPLLPERAAAAAAVAEPDAVPLTADSRSHIKCSIVCPECNRCRCEACKEPRQLPESLCCNGRLRLSLRSILDTITCMCCANIVFYHCMNSSRLRECGSRTFEVRDDDDDDDGNDVEGVFEDDDDGDGDCCCGCGRVADCDGYGYGDGDENGNTDPECCSGHRSSSCFRCCSCSCGCSHYSCTSKFVCCTCFRLPARNRPSSCSAIAADKQKRWFRKNGIVQPLRRSPTPKKIIDFVEKTKISDADIVVNDTVSAENNRMHTERKCCSRKSCDVRCCPRYCGCWWGKRRKRKKPSGGAATATAAPAPAPALASTVDHAPRPQKKRFSFKHVLCLGALAIPLPCLLCYWPLRSGVRLIERLYAHMTRTGCRCETATTAAPVDSHINFELSLAAISATTQPAPLPHSTVAKLKDEHS